MIFTSIEFLALFLPAFLLVYALTPRAWRNAVLLWGSWIFYGWWSPAFLLLFIGLTILAWGGGLALGARRNGRLRKWLLVLLIGINAGTLFWFKYINTLVETANELLSVAGAMPMQWQRVALPIGLSFIVLQVISYLIDVYRGEVRPQRRFVWFAAYLAMFGQLIAGPILRYEWVERELASRSFNWVNFSAGARRFMIGMCMKVLVADTLSPLVDAAFVVPDPSFLDSWLACLAYTLQLFFDFAGYSAMAIGLGQMLGFHFPENFNNPYLARSIQDFWRRWHISLSTWIRDYLYIPFGGNRKGAVRTYANLIVTMAIAGMWHGSDNWNFLLWGLMHGVALATARAWSRSGLPSLPILLSRVCTLLFVCMAWVIFRAADFETALSLYAGQLGLHGWALGDALQVVLQPSHLAAMALGAACIVAPLWREGVRHRTPAALLAVADLWPVLGFVFAMALVASRKAVPFLYFQF
ncbi:MBOAT family O-acyltransferase [Pusillimonas sp.]|uniref:MBOAT family O-acyltransferase n=1 Tax=Pusillimonas sp. TaxID=3040095 RepID=UPI0029B0782C|nr:MBOAT family O-acyltransferase [Pusillimonas sp.]MDX3895527.1 MBOAT family O-acyltransferase [Pusillimonas sp.]